MKQISLIVVGVLIILLAGLLVYTNKDWLNTKISNYTNSGPSEVWNSKGQEADAGKPAQNSNDDKITQDDKELDAIFTHEETEDDFSDIVL